MAKKKRRTTQRIMIGVSFLFFTSILMINNTTQLLQTYGIPLSRNLLTIISVIGIFASSIWAIILASMGEFT